MMQSEVADILAGLPFAALLIGYDEKIVAANATAQSLFGQAIIARHHGIALRQPAVLQAIDAALLRRESSVVRQSLAGQVHEVVHRVTVSAVRLKEWDGGKFLDPAIAPRFAMLTELDLSGLQLQDDDLTAFADSAQFPRLR